MLLIRLILISFCCFNCAFAQLQIASAYNKLTEDASFAPNFMQQKRVLQITTTISKKKTLEAMIPLSKKYIYHFSRKGSMVKKEIVFTDNSDPKNTHYTYDDVGNLTSEQTNEYNSFFTNYYEYDHLGRIKVLSTYREVGVTTENGNVIIESRNLVDKKNYSYQPVSNGTKKHYHNNYGRIYKYDLTTLSADGLIQSIQTKFISVRNYGFKKIFYADKIPIRVELEEDGKVSEFRNVYDGKKRLQKQDVYINNASVFTTEYIYNDDGLLTAQIRMDHSQDEMLIYQYNYKHY
jgi:hypothetical protein